MASIGMRILVVIDRDDDNCIKLKETLDDIAIDAKLRLRALPCAGSNGQRKKAVEAEMLHGGRPDLCDQRCLVAPIVC
jgi:hypothetical protein